MPVIALDILWRPRLCLRWAQPAAA
jgi:hypothetical protein